jgi:hypothetical protein
MSRVPRKKKIGYRLSRITANRQRAASVEDGEARQWERIRLLNKRLEAEAKPVIEI